MVPLQNLMQNLIFKKMFTPNMTWEINKTE